MYFRLDGKPLLFVLVLFIGSVAFGLGNEKPIDLSKTELQEAVSEYLSKTVEAKELHRLSGTLGAADIYIIGGASARIVRAVDQYLKTPSGQRKGLPGKVVDLLSATQDIDFVIDGNQEQIEKWSEEIPKALPYKLGDKTLFQVMPLYPNPERGVLNNPDILNQNTDSFSTGLLKIVSKPGSTLAQIIDIRHPSGASEAGGFLSAVISDKIDYLDSDRHESTSMAREGRNPKAVSATKYLVNLSRYGSSFDEKDFETITEIIKTLTADVAEAPVTRGPGDAFPGVSSRSLDYILERIEENLIKGLLESPDLARTLELYERAGVNDFADIIDKRFPAHSDQNWVSSPLTLKQWVSYFSSRQFASVDTLLSQKNSKNINDIDDLPHGLHVPGSQMFGGLHASMFIDKESFEYFAYLVLQAYLQQRETFIADFEVVQLAEKYQFYVNSIIEKDKAGDALVKFNRLPTYSCSSDCRNDALSGRVLYNLLGFEAYTNFLSDHAVTYVKFGEKYFETYAYNTLPPYEHGLIGLEDFFSIDKLEQEKGFEVMVGVPAEPKLGNTLEDFGHSLFWTEGGESSLNSVGLSLLLGFFEAVVADDPGAVKAVQEIFHRTFSGNEKATGSLESVSADFKKIDVPLCPLDDAV